MVVKSSKERLYEFVRSDMRWRPGNIDDYGVLGSRYGSCFVCDSKLGNNHTELVKDGARICHDCRTAVLKYGGINPSALRDKIVQDRINDFMFYGEIAEEDLLLHHIYTPHNCAMCSERIDETQGGDTEIPIPVSPTLIIPPQKLCKDCNTQVGWDHMNFPEEICISCASSYPITEKEREERERNGTIGGHLCPTCFHNQYKFIDLSTMNVTPEGLIDRTQYRHCGVCGNKDVFDLTLHHTGNPFPKQETYTCKSCLEKRQNNMTRTIVGDPGGLHYNIQITEREYEGQVLYVYHIMEKGKGMYHVIESNQARGGDIVEYEELLWSLIQKCESWLYHPDTFKKPDLLWD